MKVYRYGALQPTAGLALLLEQLRLASRYRNALVELHNWHTIAKQRAKADLDQSGYDDEVHYLKAILSEESRWLRSRCELGWGTYQQIEADVQRALRSPFRPPRPGSGRARRWAQLRALGLNPTWFRAQFSHFDGTGRIGATLQACNEAVTDDLFGNGGPVRLSGRTGKQVARLRVLGEQWIDLPVLLHRPLPAGVRIVRAILCRERIGSRYVYSLHLTVRAAATTPPRGTGNCAVNFGWRRTEAGTRIAFAVGDDGSTMELVLPRRLTDAMKHSEQLRSLADEHAVAYLGSAKLRSRARREALRDLGTPGYENRELGKVPTDGVPRSREHWARRDRHLYQWERDEYAHMIRTRRQLYHLWTLALAARYDTVTVEDYNLARLIERDKPTEIPQARHVRFLVAPGSLREEVADVFGAERTTLLKPRGRTIECSVCGEACKWDKARKLVHTCEHCGATWDQDANNSENQLVDAAAE